MIVDGDLHGAVVETSVYQSEPIFFTLKTPKVQLKQSITKLGNLLDVEVFQGYRIVAGLKSAVPNSAFTVDQHVDWLVASVSEMVKNEEVMRRLVKPIDQNQSVLWQIQVVEVTMRVLWIFDDQCAECAVASLHPWNSIFISQTYSHFVFLTNLNESATYAFRDWPLGMCIGMW
jgi:hypothetical protein